MVRQYKMLAVASFGALMLAVVMFVKQNDPEAFFMLGVAIWSAILSLAE